MVEVVIGLVSVEDAKPNGQRVTERGRLSHPADFAKTDETISNPKPGQLFNADRILALKTSCLDKLKANCFPLCGAKLRLRMLSDISDVEKVLCYFTKVI